MTKALTMLKPTLTLLVISLLLALHFESAASFVDDEESEDVEEYVLDSIFSNNEVRRSRFLASTVKKDSQCDAKKKSNKCNGVSANKGTSLLNCCKKHCRNVLGDRNNCGQCGNKCGLNERCCGGTCTDVLKNKNNCGKCNKTCRKGVKCGNGFCGYA